MNAYKLVTTKGEVYFPTAKDTYQFMCVTKDQFELAEKMQSKLANSWIERPQYDDEFLPDDVEKFDWMTDGIILHNGLTYDHTIPLHRLYRFMDFQRLNKSELGFYCRRFQDLFMNYCYENKLTPNDITSPHLLEIIIALGIEDVELMDGSLKCHDMFKEVEEYVEQLENQTITEYDI